MAGHGLEEDSAVGPILDLLDELLPRPREALRVWRESLAVANVRGVPDWVEVLDKIRYKINSSTSVDGSGEREGYQSCWSPQ
jgi:hypothetical protein